MGTLIAAHDPLWDKVQVRSALIRAGEGRRSEISVTFTDGNHDETEMEELSILFYIFCSPGLGGLMIT